MGGVAEFLFKVLEHADEIATAGAAVADVIAAIRWGKDKAEGFKATGADPTEADWDELNAMIAANTAKINAG